MKEMTTVRLSKKTRARLDDYLQSQLERHYRNQIKLPRSGKPGQSAPSIDFVINMLLDRVYRKRQRDKKRRDLERGFALEELLDLPTRSSTKQQP
jgi:hypothetical protein